MAFRFISVSAVLLFMVACAKPPVYPIEPVIEFKDISKTVLHQGTSIVEDSLEVVLSFTDGDGDLGSTDNTENGIFVVDTRRGDTIFSGVIPFIPQEGVGDAISGEINVRVPTVCCIQGPNIACQVIPNFPYDTTYFQIFIRDRAGNESNKIITPALQIICD
jgi:hypothetical protein